MRIDDTTTEAREVQLAIWRAMSGEERLLMALAMSDDVRRITLAGIAHRQPGLNPLELASRTGSAAASVTALGLMAKPLICKPNPVVIVSIE